MAFRHALSTLMLLAAGLWPAVAHAQTPMRTVEFQEAVDQAIARNPTLASAATSIARADALLQQARAVLRPIVTGAVTNVMFESAQGTDDSAVQPPGLLILGANASMPLLAPEGAARVGQSRDQIEVATLATAEVRQQIAVATAYAYLGVVAARRQIEVNERAVESARALLDFAQRRLEGGAGSRLNQVRAAQALSAGETQLEAVRFALREAQEALGTMLAENGPVDAGAEPVFDVPAPGDPAGWLGDRPDVQLQTRTIAAAERVLSDSSKSWLPTLGVTFTPQVVTRASDFSGGYGFQLGLNLSQRIFDRRPAAEKALRQVNVSQARFVLDDIELRARAEERLAREKLTSSERVLASSLQTARLATEVLEISTAAFELGATTNLDVVLAQRAARDADTTAALAEDAARRARFELLVAMGRFK